LSRKMIIGLKRPPVYDPDFHDHVKRYRLELEMESSEDPVCIPGCPSWASAEEIIAAALSCSLDAHHGRRGRMDDSPQEPVEKRMRVDCGPSPADCNALGGKRSWE